VVDNCVYNKPFSIENLHSEKGGIYASTVMVFLTPASFARGIKLFLRDSKLVSAKKKRLEEGLRLRNGIQSSVKIRSSSFLLTTDFGEPMYTQTPDVLWFIIA